MQRRHFIRNGCIACVGATGMGMLLHSCASTGSMAMIHADMPDDKILKIPVEKFGKDKNMLLLRNNKLRNDILLIKEKEGYRAMLMLCTHEGFALTVTPGSIYCSEHGSSFDMQGNVLKEPALKPLKQYKTAIQNTDIIIYLS
jgi:Rieske Fe-S protein